MFNSIFQFIRVKQIFLFHPSLHISRGLISNAKPINISRRGGGYIDPPPFYPPFHRESKKTPPFSDAAVLLIIFAPDGLIIQAEVQVFIHTEPEPIANQIVLPPDR